MKFLAHTLTAAMLVIHLVFGDTRVYLNPTSRKELVETPTSTSYSLDCPNGEPARIIPEWEHDYSFQYVCPYKKPDITYDLFVLAFILSLVTEGLSFIISMKILTRNMKSLGVISLVKRSGLALKCSFATKVKPLVIRGGDFIESKKVYTQLIIMLILIAFQYI